MFTKSQQCKKKKKKIIYIYIYINKLDILCVCVNKIRSVLDIDCERVAGGGDGERLDSVGSTKGI